MLSAIGGKSASGDRVDRPPDGGGADRWPRLARAVLLVLAGVAMLGIALDQATFTRRYENRVLPGVSAAGVDLGGLTEGEAAAALREAAGSPDGLIELRDPEDRRTWRFEPEELGLAPAWNAAASAAIEVGREPNGPLARYVEQQSVRLMGRRVTARGAGDLDEEAARRTLLELAPEVDTPPRDAVLQPVDGRVEATIARPGHQLDVSGTLERLRELAGNLESARLDLAVTITSPRVFDLRDIAEAYTRLTEHPVTMLWRGRRFEIAPDVLRGWFVLEEGMPVAQDQTPAIIVDTPAIERWLTDEVAPEVRQYPKDARFRYELGRVKVLRSAQDGAELDVEASVQRVVDAAYTDVRVGELAVRVARPNVVAADRDRIQGAVPRVWSYVGYAGSPVGRTFNLELAAAAFDGVALAPGQTLSVRDTISQTDAMSAFDTYWLGRPSDGLTQLATGVFRAALSAGFPIVERHSPPVRIGWLEPPVGLDADMSDPGHDLRFTNDTRNFVLFAARLDANREALEVEVTLRREPPAVTFEGPSVRAISAVPEDGPLETTVPTLPAGARLQVGWAREGAEVRMARIVNVDGAPRTDVFESLYAPARDVYLIGP